MRFVELCVRDYYVVFIWCWVEYFKLNYFFVVDVCVLYDDEVFDEIAFAFAFVFSRR